MNKNNYQLSSSLGQSYFVGPGGLTIGRFRTSHIVINDPRVSRLHARLLFAAGRYWIRDEQSKSGTFVNGSLVAGQQELKPGDILQIGGVTFQLTPTRKTTVLLGTKGSKARRNQLVFIGIVGAVLILIVTAIGVGSGGGSRKIAWQSSQADFTLRAGTTGDLMVEFTPSSNMSGLTVAVSPELEDMLAVDVTTIPDLKANQKYSLLLTAQAPVVKKTGNFQGELHFSVNGRPVEQRLPVSINITGLNDNEIPPTVGNPSEDRIVADATGQKIIKDELVVGLKFETADPDECAREIARNTGGVFLGSIPETLTYQIVYVVSDLNQLESLRQQVEAMPDVDFASHDFITETASTIPDDTEYDSWDENSPAGNNWNLEFIKAPSAWDLTTGSSSVNVAVVDWDIDKDHSDLNDNIISVDGNMTSGNGHGTHVAGIICAEGNNKQGVTGLMWDCSLQGYNLPSNASFEAIAEKMVNAANGGARIVNMSLGLKVECGVAGTDATLETVREGNSILGRSILYAQRVNKDVLWIFSAGNECRDAKYQSPASLTANFPLNTIAVAAINQSGELSDFSNFGKLVTVAAPGGNRSPYQYIYSTLPRSCILWVFCSDNYGGMAGTSQAAPQVSGLAGLVLSQHPDYSSTQIKQCILAGAQSGGKQVPGQDFYIINAFDAVKCEGKISLPTQVDIVFAIDLTGSMSDELDKVKAEVGDIVHDLTTVASPSTDFHFAVVSFEDYPGSFDSRSCDSSYQNTYGLSGSKPNGDAPFRVDLDLTADVNALYATIPTLSLGDGKDDPESYARVLWELGQPAANSKIIFRDDALKLIVNFGDSVPHDPNLNEGIGSPPLTPFDTGIDPGRNGVIDCGGDDIDLQDDALPALVDRNIHLLYIDSSGDADFEPYWRYWTSVTGGAYAAINQDGTIPGSLNLSELIMNLLGLINKTP
jgi:subtilisin family serine protease